MADCKISHQIDEYVGPAYIGIFREGQGAYGLFSSDWNNFNSNWEQASNSGLRLISISTHLEGSTPIFTGVYREGSDGYYLLPATTIGEIELKLRELCAVGLRLIDINTYLEGDIRKHLGVFREGTDAHHLVVEDWNNFVRSWTRLSDEGMRLICMAT